MTVAALALVACASIASSSSSSPPSAPPEGVAWFDGKVEDAFARARQEGRPLFLYWGAVWCPPCNQIKKTIFSRGEFARKMEAFLPVYLDGDTERAQIWGEKLKASGYPTMIVYSSAGDEVMRMPTGLQVDQFLHALDDALEQMTPMKALLDQALAADRGDAVPDATWNRIAFHSWGQDETVGLEPAEAEAALRKLKDKVPAKLATVRSRLFTHWLGEAVSLAKDAKDGAPLSADDRAQADLRLREILGSRDLTLANLEFLYIAAGDTVRCLHPTASPERTRLIALWEQTMEKVERDESLSVDERISSLVPSLEFHRLSHGDKALPAAFQARVRTRAAWADEAAKDLYTRQAAISTAGYLLKEVGLAGEARDLYLRQLDRAVSPHYFMSSLASLAEADGKTAEAVEWMRKAYETSEGRATRVQWGTGYLLGLIRLQPKDAAAIERESVRVLGEMVSFEDAFAGRNQARVKRLAESFKKWNAGGENARRLATLRKELIPACASLPAGGAEVGADAGADAPSAADSMRGRCEAFFGGLGES